MKNLDTTIIPKFYELKTMCFDKIFSIKTSNSEMYFYAADINLTDLGEVIQISHKTQVTTITLSKKENKVTVLTF